jgi:hypothetical protein
VVIAFGLNSLISNCVHCAGSGTKCGWQTDGNLLPSWTDFSYLKEYSDQNIPNNTGRDSIV